MSEPLPATETEAPQPDHVESAVQAIANLHAEHEASANASERIVDAITARLGRPATSAILLVFVILWTGLNLAFTAFGLSPFDKPPFEWLELFLSLAAALMTIVILTSQVRAEVLASRRQQLMLQLTLLNDHRQAKVVALLEELRRDDPLIRDRTDRQADAMTKTTNPAEVLDAIEETRGEIIATGHAKKG